MSDVKYDATIEIDISTFNNKQQFMVKPQNKGIFSLPFALFKDNVEVNDFSCCIEGTTINPETPMTSITFLDKKDESKKAIILFDGQKHFIVTTNPNPNNKLPYIAYRLFTHMKDGCTELYVNTKLKCTLDIPKSCMVFLLKIKGDDSLKNVFNRMKGRVQNILIVSSQKGGKRLKPSAFTRTSDHVDIGKLKHRLVYKKQGDRKKYIKYKGEFRPVSQVHSLLKAIK